jgi:hypothetical protein
MADLQALMKSEKGITVISILLGFGLATMFRKACEGNSCIVIKGPKQSDIQGKKYRVDDHCYKYVPYVVKCESSGKK